jgi:hypothetical protein
MAIAIIKETVHSPTARSISITSTDPVFMEICLALQDLKAFIHAGLARNQDQVIHTRENIKITADLDGKIYKITVEVDGKPLTVDTQGHPAASYTYDPASYKSTKTKKTSKVKS